MSIDPDNLGDRFLTAFNRIDEHLRAETKLQDRTQSSFNRVLRAYVDKHRGWRYGQDLRRFGELRNAMVHEHYEQGRPLAVPTHRTTERIEQIRDALLNPVRVDSGFQCAVATTTPSEKIDVLLVRVRERDFSQFPVVEDGRFHGLVTENGITRWLARRIGDQIIDFTAHQVGDVLGCEESQDNYTFIPRNMLLDDVIEQFREKPSLEAALITERGAMGASFIGIITRWDIVHALPV